jgi:hypothetical protein
MPNWGRQGGTRKFPQFLLEILEISAFMSRNTGLALRTASKSDTSSQLAGANPAKIVVFIFINPSDRIAQPSSL